MPLLQNYPLKIICAIFTIVWTCTLLFPTHLNAQETGIQIPNFVTSSAMEANSVSRNEVEKLLPNTTKFSTPLELTQSNNLTLNTHYILPDTSNKPSTLNLLPDTTDSRLKTTFPTATSSRQAPQINISWHGALTEGIILHFELRDGLTANERSREASAQHYQVLDYAPRLKTSGHSALTDSIIRHFERNEELATNRVEKPHSKPRSSRQARTDVIQPTFQFTSSLITGSARTLPFHLHTNRLGTVDPNSTNFLNRIRATGYLYDSENFKLDYGADLALRVSDNSTAFFPELFAGAEYKAFRLDFGRFDRPIGLNNHDLSIGSMMVSRNAVPIPRIMLSTPEFANIPWTNNILEFKAMYSHGWFTDDRYVDDAYLHQKYLYLKVNTTESISVIGGIIHNAQWGGTHPTLGRAPQSFSDYLRIVFSRAADPDSNAPPAQMTNALGNSVAAYDFAIFYEHSLFDLKLTRLFYLEDSVSTRFRSPWDGVWGVNLNFRNKNRLLNSLTYEHINTRRQDAKADQERGRAGYYNHSYYRSGWSHYSRTIGIPLIIRDPETDRVDNNIIVGHHIGLTGNFYSNMSYILLGTYTRNYGTAAGFYKAPRGSIDFEERREDRYSFLFEVNYTLKSIDSLSFSLSTAFDAGEFRESSIGGSLGVRYSFD